MHKHKKMRSGYSDAYTTDLGNLGLQHKYLKHYKFQETFTTVMFDDPNESVAYNYQRLSHMNNLAS